MYINMINVRQGDMDWKISIQSTPLISTHFLSKNSVLIRKVSFGGREHHMHSLYLLLRMCVLSRGVSSLESFL